MIIGLTGGIGSGKSTVSNILRGMGYEIVDADRVAYDITNEEKNLSEIVKMFGEEVIVNSKLDRKALGKKVFSDKSKLEKLNALLHPQVIEYFKKRKEENNSGHTLIFDVPLLFEVGLDKLCDKILVVSLNYETQIERIVKRDNCSRQLAIDIIASQMPLEEKIIKSDLVITNDGTLEDLEKQVKHKLTNFIKNDNMR